MHRKRTNPSTPGTLRQDHRDYFNYGLTEQTIRSSISREDLVNWEKNFVSKLRNISKAPVKSEYTGLPPYPALNLKSNENTQSTVEAHWMRPVLCINSETINSHPSDSSFLAMPSSDPAEIPLFTLKDGVLNWREAYTKEYSSVKG